MVATTVGVGERVYIAPDAFFSYRRTGTISDVPEPGTHARVLLESGGIVREVAVEKLSPALLPRAVKQLWHPFRLPRTQTDRSSRIQPVSWLSTAAHGAYAR